MKLIQSDGMLLHPPGHSFHDRSIVPFVALAKAVGAKRRSSRASRTVESIFRFQIRHEADRS